MPGRTLRRDLLAGSLLALGYWAAVIMGLRWAMLPAAGTPVWPAAGVAFAGLVLGGSRLWPAVLLARVAASLTVGTTDPFWVTILVGLATTLGAYLPVRLLEGVAPLDPRLGSMRAMLWLILGGALAGGLISASLGIGTVWLGGLDGARVPYAWLNWWFGFFVGVLTIAPPLLAWLQPDAFRMPMRSWAHLVICLGVVLILSAVVFLGSGSVVLRTWHILPALVWTALSFNVRGLSLALAITSVCAIAGAVNGTGSITASAADEGTRVFLTQQFIAMTALTLLVLAAVADERREVEALGRLAAIVASSPEAMVSLDRRGRFVSWNQGAERLFGWSTAEALGRGSELIMPPDQAENDAIIDRVLAGEILARETVRVQRDGTRVDVAITAAPVRAPDGSIIGLAGVIRDIRERKRTEAALHQLTDTLEQRVALRTRELEEANASLRAEIGAREAAEAQLRQSQKMEAVGQLTGGIAHDFNNMLAVVIGSLDLVRGRSALEPRADALVGQAMEAAQRAAQLTARLLAFSRQQPLSPEPTDANRLVSGMSELLCRTLGETHRIETVLAAGLWLTFVDAHQLENALLNLAVNARDAMPGGGRLTIETANTHLDDDYMRANPDVTPGQYVLLSVTDSGTGIPPAMLERVFDPFFTTKEPGKGTGLGLSMVYGFVRQSGGSVKIYSEEGRGTSVKLYLPRWYGNATARPKAEESDGALPRAQDGEAVLVVEDETEVRRLSVQMLSDLGYAVVEAADAFAALERLDANPRICLLFTDVVMADMDGQRLAERARERRPDLKVLYTTGYTQSAVIHHGILEPDIALLPKPFTLAQLAIKVQQVLR